MAYITIGEIRIFLLFPFLHPIFCFIKSLFFLKLTDDFPSEKNLSNSLSYTFISHLSLLLQIIPEIISIIRQKRKKLKLIQRNAENKNFVFSNFEIINYKVLGLIILSNILNSYPSLIERYVSQDSQFYFYFNRFSLLFFLAIQSFLILNIKIYIHQYIAIIILFIGTLFIIITTKCYIEFKLIYFIFFLSGLFLNCLSICIHKYILEVYYISPFMILLIQGVFGIIFDCLIILFLKYLDLIIMSDFSFFIQQVNIFQLIIYSLCYSLTQIFIMLTNFYFSPTMVGVSDYISSFALTLLTNIKWYKFICYIILIFGCIIYNEILILNFCDLNKFTKQEISRRSINEFKVKPLSDDESILDDSIFLK